MTNDTHQNRPFLVVTAVQRPAKGVDTGKKGWANEPANWATFERTMVVDRLTTAILTEAQFVIDIMRGECVKNRSAQPDDTVTEHYLGKYMQECKKGVDAWLSKQARSSGMPVSPVADILSRIKGSA